MSYFSPLKVLGFKMLSRCWGEQRAHSQIWRRARQVKPLPTHEGPPSLSNANTKSDYPPPKTCAFPPTTGSNAGCGWTILTHVPALHATHPSVYPEFPHMRSLGDSTPVCSPPVPFLCFSAHRLQKTSSSLLPWRTSFFSHLTSKYLLDHTTYPPHLHRTLPNEMSKNLVSDLQTPTVPC